MSEDSLQIPGHALTVAIRYLSVYRLISSAFYAPPDRRPSMLHTRSATLGVFVLTMLAASCSSGGSNELTVLVRFNESQFNSVTCDPGNKIDRQFAGGRVSVQDSDGSKIGTATISGSARDLSSEESGSQGGGCEWKVSINDVADSDIYTVSLELPGGYSDESDFSRSELADDDWQATFSVSN